MMRKPQRVFSIRWIVTGLSVALTAAAVLSVSYVSERNARTALTSELQSRLLLEARNLAQASAPALLGDFPELTLHPLVREKLSRQPEFSFAVVVDHAGLIQGDRDPQRLGTRWQLPERLHDVRSASLLAPGEDLTQSPAAMVVRVPVTLASGRTIGEVVVGMRTSYLERTIAAARRQHAIVFGIFLLIGMAVSFGVVSQVLKPIQVLRAGIERIAQGDLETPIRVRDRTELGLLSDAVNDMSARLKQAQAEMVERERLAHELDLAREIQRSLFPAVRTVAGPFVLEGAHHAAAEVGGDYFDYFLLPNGAVGLTVADVSGKGLGGCLVMSMLSALLRANPSGSASPAAVLAALDDQLSPRLQSGSFVTMFYGILDPDSGRLTYASAGHNPTFVYRGATGAIDRIHATGIPIGAVRGGAVRSTLEDLVIDLAPGDALVQYTDGVNEAFDPAEHEQFGFDRIEAVLRDCAPRGPRGILEGLHEAVANYTAGVSPMDDETLLVVWADPAFRPASGLPVVGDACGAGDADEALRLYEEAKRRGQGVRLAACTDILMELETWIATTPPLSLVPRGDAELLKTTLFETCANVVEHGSRGGADPAIEVWWVPPAGAPSTVHGAEEASVALRAGEFVIRDHGAPFEANEWTEKDFEDPAVRSRGRGLGLEIIHRVMRPVRYNPATSLGNITIMRFGVESAPKKEKRHA